jgi:4-hydroxy-2-oxoheptanedioate aldolase
VKAADEATLIAIQLEDQLAIDNIDEPLEIEDVDVFFIGPADLSQSMVTRGIRKHQPSRKLSSAVSARWCPRAAHRARLLSRKNVHEVLEKGVR